MQIEKNTPKSGWRPFTMLIYGMPKVGKSTLAAEFSPAGMEGSLILDTENGTEEISCNRIKVANLDELPEALNIAYKSAFSNITIDTIDEVYHWAESSAIKTLNAKMRTSHTAVEEFGYGVGYAVARAIMLNVIGKLHVFKSVGKTVLLISHQKQSINDTDSEKSRTVELPGKLSRMLAASVDAIALVYVRKDKRGKLHRWMSFQPYEQVDAGCRLRELAGKDIPFTFDAIYHELTKGKAGVDHEQQYELVATGCELPSGNGRD